MSMTQEQRDAQDAITAARKPMEDWSRDMKATDAEMPRYVEDIIGALSDTVRGKIPSETLDKYNAKKTLRGERPA